MAFVSGFLDVARMFSRFVHVVAALGLCAFSWPSVTQCTDSLRFVSPPPPVDGHMGRSHLLAIVGNAAVNTVCNFFAWVYVKHLLLI